MHVGQYSEGEFIAPSAIKGNMTTLREIPDDIFDSVNTSSKWIGNWCTSSSTVLAFAIFTVFSIAKGLTNLKMTLTTVLDSKSAAYWEWVCCHKVFKSISAKVGHQNNSMIRLNMKFVRQQFTFVPLTDKLGQAVGIFL